MKKLAIFDLDGTLLNTIADLGQACNHALKELGYTPHPIRAYNYMVGNGVRKLIEKAQPDADEATVDKLLEIFKDFYNEHCTDKTLPYPGIPELLSNLKDNGLSLAVASNKYESAVVKIINHFFGENYFDVVMGNVEGLPRKPDPSIIFSILLKHPTPKSEVMFIGDSGIDIETGKRAGVESIGVTWGFRSKYELRQACADHIVSSPEEILNFLEDPF